MARRCAAVFSATLYGASAVPRLAPLVDLYLAGQVALLIFFIGLAVFCRWSCLVALLCASAPLIIRPSLALDLSPLNTLTET